MLTSHGTDMSRQAILDAGVQGEAGLLELLPVEPDGGLYLDLGVVPLGLGHIAPPAGAARGRGRHPR